MTFSYISDPKDTPLLGAPGGHDARVRARDIPENLTHAHVPILIVPMGPISNSKSFVCGTAIGGRLVGMIQP